MDDGDSRELEANSAGQTNISKDGSTITPLICPACGATYEWRIEAPEKPFPYLCPNCGVRSNFPALIKKNSIERLRASLSRNKFWLLIMIGGWLIGYLFFRTSGINYSGPMGKYGGSFLDHVAPGMDASPPEFSNFLVLAWLLIPAIAGVISFLAIAEHVAGTKRGKRKLNISILILAAVCYILLLAAITTIYSMSLHRAEPPNSNLDYFYPKTSPYPSIFICVLLVLVVIGAALMDFIHDHEIKNRKKILKILGTALIVLMLVATPFFVQIVQVGKKASSIHSRLDYQNRGEIYDYLASSHVDMKWFLPPHCRILPFSLDWPPYAGYSMGSADVYGTPYKNRDQRKVFYIGYDVACSSYDQANDFYANNFAKADSSFDNKYYFILSQTTEMDDVIIVNGESNLNRFDFSRAIILND